jgi:hypothetical protein
MKTQILTLRASEEQSVGTVTGAGVRYDDQGGSRIIYREALVMLNVLEAATAVGDTLDVYIDTSPDGGNTWINIGHFAQILGNGGAKKQVMALKSDNPGATAVADVTSDAAAGATRQFGIGDRLRYRGVCSTSGVFTYAVTAMVK